MKLHKGGTLTKVLPIFRRVFPNALFEQMEKEFLPQGNYARSATPRALVQSIMKAIILRLSSQGDIIRECPELRLSGASSLSYDLDRSWLLEYTTELNSYLANRHPIYDPAICRHPRLLLDSEPCMMQITQRGTCAKFNNVAKGCGIMNVFNLDASEDQCVVQVLKIMPGSWNDTYQVRDVSLIPDGPIYIADRGFYSRETINLWLMQSIHFIMRAKKYNLRYTVVESLKKPRARKNSTVTIESDEIVMLGKPNAKFRCKVRLLKAWLRSGEDLWLVSDQFDVPAKELLDPYLKRGKIEVYHRFSKQSLGFAHLYSFDQIGIESQAQVTALLVNLLYLSARGDPPGNSDRLGIVAKKLTELRKKLGVRNPWKRNTFAQRRIKPEHNRRHIKKRTPTILLEANL